MLSEQLMGHKVRTISLSEYAADLLKRGIHTLPGSSGAFWAQYESAAMMRIPPFHLEPPTSSEIRKILWQGRAAIVSYLQEPDEHHPTNAMLYLCADQTYALEKLAPEDMGRNVRRGFKQLTISFLTAEQVLAHGAPAFCETCRRLGLSGRTPEEFREYFTDLTRQPEYVFLGAWKDNQLAAFQSIIEVEDWAILVGSYSMDALRRYKPNETLQYSALSHYLVERRFRLVSNSVSSIQAASNAAGIHRFKTKVGFEAHPVHRAFVLHPLLRPFATRLTLWVLSTALRFSPENRRLKKVRAVLACILGDTSGLEAAVGSICDE